MKWRTCLFCCLALGAFIAALVVFNSVRSRCPVDLRPETLEMLKNGMTESEISDILGCPPGDYTTQPGIIHKTSGSVHTFRGTQLFEHSERKEWLTDKYAVFAYFAPDGKAILIRCGDALNPPPPSARYPPPFRQILHPFIDR
jgi:hypothetical protein